MNLKPLSSTANALACTLSALYLALPSFAVANIDSDLSITYTGDTFQNVSGGVRRGNAYLDLLDITLNTEVELSETWTLTAAVQGLYSNGNSISEELTGDIKKFYQT